MTAAVIVSAAAPAMAEELVGVLVDHACYTTLNAEQIKAADYKTCGIAGAQKGHRLAVITTKGDVYLVTGPLTQDNNAKLIPLINQIVVVIGELRKLDLLPARADGEGADAEVDDRRNGRREDEVVVGDVRKGDFREGDVREGEVMTIEAISAVERLNILR